MSGDSKLNLGSDAGWGNQLLTNSMASGGINRDGSSPTFDSWLHGFTGTVTGGGDKLFSNHDKPETKVAGAPPDPGAVTQANLQNQLQQEVALRAQRTSFVSTGGLLDSQPNTASRVLLGS